MPKIAKPLTAIEVKRLDGEGFHMVGTVSGLGLKISASGARSWILRTQITSRRTDMGLGAYPAITLARAHELARDAKDAIKDGRDPIKERKDAQTDNEWSFQRCAEIYIKAYRSTWKSDKHAQQWENTLATYAYPKIGKTPIRNITMANVLEVIKPDRGWHSHGSGGALVRPSMNFRVRFLDIESIPDFYRPMMPQTGLN